MKNWKRKLISKWLNPQKFLHVKTNIGIVSLICFFPPYRRRCATRSSVQTCTFPLNSLVKVLFGTGRMDIRQLLLGVHAAAVIMALIPPNHIILVV